MNRLSTWLTALPLLLGLVGCGQNPDAANGAAKPESKPPRSHLVQVIPVQHESVGHSVTVTGSLRARESVRVFSREEGRVLTLPYFEGDAVAADAVLVRLDDKLLRKEYDKVVAERRRAQAHLDRVGRLAKGKLASEDELAEADKTLAVAIAEQQLLETRLGFTTISAPFTGVVSERLVEVGDVVEANSHLLTLINHRGLISELPVSELLVPYLEIGQDVQVRIDALGDRVFNGNILRIHPDIDPETRRGTVEIALDPVPEGARAGQFCRVTLTTRAAERLLIPYATLRRDREGLYVFRIREQADGDKMVNKAERVAVRIGLKLGARVEVLSGIEAGDRIVERGFMGLTPGKTVELAPAGNAGKPAKPASTAAQDAG